ncbi:MAG: cytochrome B [Gammaproteobacteria bacterium]|nr:MAG: cytochrome B [Gammaproteobacteria bacterium]
MTTLEKVRVWDPLIRLFHWSLVVLFAIAWFTGDEESELHLWSGYAIIGLLLFRLAWGFIGSRHARFSDFVRPPREVMAYLRDLAAGRARHYAGHNPAGGWMVVALLVMLAVVSFSGLMVLAAEEGRGPMAWAVTPTETTGTASPPRAASLPYHEEEDDEEEGHREHGPGPAGNEALEEFWEEVHEASTNLMLLLILIHVTGVFVSSRLHGERLVRAMITGYKELPREE